MFHSSWNNVRKYREASIKKSQSRYSVSHYTRRLQLGICMHA